MKQDAVNFLHPLLDRVREKNETLRQWAIRKLGTDESDVPHQIVHPPEAIESPHVATLNPRVIRPLSPMLRSLYAYASTWESAIVGQMLLSLSQMTGVLDNELWTLAIQTRAAHWADSPPALHHWSQLSLLAIDFYSQDETYLIWSDDIEEPRVHSYQCGLDHQYANIQELFQTYVDAPLG